MTRLKVLKTYKIFIGGSFPRTESGRYYELKNKNKQSIANVCLSSRKDFRNAVVAARSAFAGWSNKSAFNRSQILYRIAEMLEGRKSQFIEELITQGYTKALAEKEVLCSIDRLIYYAGWCDKYQQIFSSINPVASSHFNFSVLEPMGVVSIIAPENPALLGLISTIAPIIAGGNTCVVLASEQFPLSAITFSEVLATSDLPAGVINILTGTSTELHDHFSSHMDVNAIIYTRENKPEQLKIHENASINVKRCFVWNRNWLDGEQQSPYFISDLQEVKTTWHPIERIGELGGKY
ncbi:MAG: aldehyde dehydrogenase family protein [Bacteroidetes bacterium]|nr:aldehyde dehydrogenase family protein [Bacteroidota bacterium]